MNVKQNRWHIWRFFCEVGKYNFKHVGYTPAIESIPINTGVEGERVNTGMCRLGTTCWAIACNKDTETSSPMLSALIKSEILCLTSYSNVSTYPVLGFIVTCTKTEIYTGLKSVSVADYQETGRMYREE